MDSGLRRLIGWTLGPAVLSAIVLFPILYPSALYGVDKSLGWDRSAESNIAGYKLYYGTATHQYSTAVNVGNATSYTVSSLGPGTYYFAVTCYNTSGAESPYSSEVSSSTTTTTPPTPPASGGLLAAYPFEENGGSAVVDASGNLNNGTPYGVTWTTGKFGSGLSFDGSASHVTCPAGRMPAANAPQTVSAWLYRASTTTAAQNIVVLSAPNASSSVQLGFRDSKLGVWQYGDVFLVSVAAPAAYTWIHVAYTYDGTTHRLYVNGALVSSSNTSPQTASPTVLELGRWPGSTQWGPGEYFRGLADNVRIYGTALSASEISTDMNTSAASSSGGGLAPVLALGLDEGSGTTVMDDSGLGNHGTISGATWTAGRFGQALSFNGWNTYATAGTKNIPAIGSPMTLAFWLYVPGVTSNVQNALVLANTSAAAAIQAGIVNARVSVWSCGGNILIADGTPLPGAWHHYAYTYDGTTNCLYLDGTKVAESTTRGPSAPVTSVTLGRWVSGSEYLNGRIDEVRIYNRALTASEVTSVMNSPIN
jgi:hypothetical protein